MKRVSWWWLGWCVVAVLGLLGGSSYAEDPAPPSKDMQKLVTPEEFKDSLLDSASELDLEGFVKLKAQGPVVVLDVRSKDSFAARHLKGSVNIPLTDLTETTLPGAAPDKSVPVVIACDYSFFPTRMMSMTLQAYPVLKVNGYQRIYRLNLWASANEMISPTKQEQALEFEGSEVGAPHP